MHLHDRAVDVSRHLVADAVEQQAGKVAAAVRAKRDQIRWQPARIDDRRGDAAGAWVKDLARVRTPSRSSRARTAAVPSGSLSASAPSTATSTTSASERRATAITTGSARSASPCWSSATRIFRYMTSENNGDGPIAMAKRPPGRRTTGAAIAGSSGTPGAYVRLLAARNAVT